MLKKSDKSMSSILYHLKKSLDIYEISTMYQDNGDKCTIGCELAIKQVDWMKTNLFMKFEMMAINDNLNFCLRQIAFNCPQVVRSKVCTISFE